MVDLVLVLLGMISVSILVSCLQIPLYLLIIIYSLLLAVSIIELHESRFILNLRMNSSTFMQKMSAFMLMHLTLVE